MHFGCNTKHHRRCRAALSHTSQQTRQGLAHPTRTTLGTSGGQKKKVYNGIWEICQLQQKVQCVMHYRPVRMSHIIHYHTNTLPAKTAEPFEVV